MKKYKEYMDGIKASDTLHQRLVGLEKPAGRPVPWRKYGSMAAAVALVLGLGGLGYAHYYHTVVNPTGQAFLEATLSFDPAAHPDIAVVSPGELPEPGQKALKGYDVREERGGVAVTVHYCLPYIEYGGTNGTETASQVALDWDIPAGASRRDLSREEIITLLGGEDAVNTHLDWGGYELTGWAARYEDGSFWGAYIYGYEGPLDHFEFAVTAGQMPPTCIVFPDSVTQEIRGLTVTADGHDGKNGCARRVSFMKDDYGYRFDLTSTDVDQAELLVSRLVCRIADKGLDLDGAGVGAVSPPTLGEDGLYTCGICGHAFPLGSAHGHPFMGADEPSYEDGVSDYDSDCPYCADGTAHTHPYNPADTVDPQDDAPPVSVSDSPRSRGEDWCGTPGTYVCETCGETVPVDGMRAHVHSFNPEADDAMCSGYPVPEGGTTCPVCGQTLPAGMEHSHELCGLPLAPEMTGSTGSPHHGGESHHH